MKKALSILLVLLLAVSVLPAGAMAADVVLSPQNLRVDGRTITCEKYNIDGSNYFKLRDIAMVLSGTGSEFSVGWDAEKKVISVVTGEAYEPNGSELDLSGGDKSATAAVSTQTLLINGVERGDLSAYNIGGNNFFKLRDLGDALGFQVNYDKGTNTAIVVSRRWTWPVKWLTEESIYNEDGAALSHSVTTYSEEGYQLSYLYEGQYGTDNTQYTYDELGRPVKQVQDSVYSYDNGESWEDHSTTTYEYDVWGNLAKEVCQATGDVVTETSYTYDDNGNLLISETLNNAGRSAVYYSYDDNGYQIKVVYTNDDVVTDVEEYIRDAEGTIIKQVASTGDGEVYACAEFTVSDGLVTEETRSFGEEVYFYAYTYDERGNLIRIESQDPYGTTVTTRIFDEEDREVQEETTYDGGSSLSVWTYDERGLLVRYERTDSDGYYASDEYTYDEEGNTLSEVYRMEGFTRTTTYTYDRAARKMTSLTLLEHEAVG